MLKYVIISDSTTDLSAEYVAKNNVEIIPLRFTIDGQEYSNFLDGRELGFQEFYDKMRNESMSTTSQLNSEDIINKYRPFLEEGFDILGIGFSSGLSGTFNSMRIAVEILREEFKDRQIEIIDSLCASMGEGLLVDYAVKYRNEGLSLKENYEKLLELRQKLNHWFTVSDIDLLHRGGRVSGVAAFMAKTIKINPVLHVDAEGHLIPRIKKIGRKSALKELVNQMEKMMDQSINQTVFISHGDCLEDAQFVADLVKKQFECVKRIEINFIGPVIGSHSGPGTVALFFIGFQR